MMSVTISIIKIDLFAKSLSSTIEAFPEIMPK